MNQLDLEAFYAREDPIKNQVNDLIALIIKHRKTQNITQMALSKNAGVSQATISHLESFKTVPSLQVLIQVANALNLKLTLTPNERSITS